MKPAPRSASSFPFDLERLPAAVMIAIILGATLLAYGPALAGGFLWDDLGHVTAPSLRSLAGLARIWFEPGATQQYYPVLHSAFWLEHRLWGDATVGYHLLNVLLHVTAACLVGRLLLRLAVPGAWLAALIFALHPVGVESVAWISEQKNTLSAVFYLAAALAYLRFDEHRREGAYALALVMFVLALLTKSVTATLPAALLVVVWWQRGRLEWRRDVVPLLPWFVVGAASGLFTAYVERTQIGAQGADFTLGAIERVLLAARVVWFYLAKLIWPANLSFVYPRWTIDATDAAQYVAPLALVALLAALAFWSRRNRAPLAIALLFGGTLFPVLGFVNVYPFVFSYVADHFQYLACIAIIALVAAALTRLPRGLALIGATSLVVTLGALTWSQSRDYRDVITLYEATLARNPAAWMAHNNLGMALVQSGRAGQAEAHFQAALRLRTNYAEGENNLGDCLTRLNRAAEAVPHLERALQLRPRYPEAHNNLGAALMALGRRAEGVAQFEAAVQLKPDYAVAQFNLGLATASGGRPAEAIPHFEQALRAQPDYPEAELNWAIALTVTKRFAEAEPHFERAVQLRPDYAEAQMMFGRGLTTVGRVDDAISHYQRALEIDPGYAAAHLNLALALRQTGRLQEAEEHLTEAQRLGARVR